MCVLLSLFPPTHRGVNTLLITFIACCYSHSSQHQPPPTSGLLARGSVLHLAETDFCFIEAVYLLMFCSRFYGFCRRYDLRALNPGVMQKIMKSGNTVPHQYEKVLCVKVHIFWVRCIPTSKHRLKGATDWKVIHIYHMSAGARFSFFMMCTGFCWLPKFYMEHAQ